MTDKTPLCVDLDETLIRTNLLFECVLLLAKNNPFYLLLFPYWLLQGRCYFKQQLAELCYHKINFAALPYNESVLQYIQQRKKEGANILLVSASPEQLVIAVSAHLKVFSDVMASFGEVNLKGETKARALVARFGADNFDYMGDSYADLSVWSQARKAIAVTNSAVLRRRLQQRTAEVHFLPRPQANFFAWLRAIRLHQWTKNGLVFVPLIVGHYFNDLELWVNSVLAFLALSLVASSTYLFNDLLDLTADRLHERKSARAVASGVISLPQAVFAIGLLLFTGLCFALSISEKTTMVVIGYATVSVSYSLYFKQCTIVDILLLAMLFTCRVLIGAVATEVVISEWLLLFALFFFFSLASVKRLSELLDKKAKAENCVPGRSYQVIDIPQISMFGIASGYIALLVLALYIYTPAAQAMYEYPLFLWCLVPLLLYWLTRIWLITGRGKMHYDPIVFAIRDQHSYLVLLLALLVFILSCLPL